MSGEVAQQERLIPNDLLLTIGVIRIIIALHTDWSTLCTFAFVDKSPVVKSALLPAKASTVCAL